jgi:acetylornithine deacetylase/succinyl-diaminopimelate desuccinylase-like protein
MNWCSARGTWRILQPRPSAAVSPALIVGLIALLPLAGRWTAAQGSDEATRLLQAYVRIDTSNPPGDTRKAADFLADLFQREGIPVTRYESAPGKAIIYARLAATRSPRAGKAVLLLNHMDVVPADRSQWKVDPFAAEVRNGELWGRGSFDMKGQAVAQILAFLRLKRERIPLARDVILLAEPDEEVGGVLGARWMIANHYGELDPEYVIDEGGFGSRDLFASGKLVYGIAVAEKKIVWLKVRAEGIAGHGSQPHDQNPNDRLVRAIARLLAGHPGGGAPTGSADARPADSTARQRPPSLVDVMKANVGTFAVNKFTSAVQQSTIAVTWLKSGVGEPPKINVIPSVAEAGLDCRVLPGTTKDQWLAEVAQRLGDPTLKIEVINESDDPLVTPHDTALYRHLEEAIRQRHPDAIVTPLLIPYGTDSNAFRPKGAKSYGIFPAIVSADTAASMHGDAEHVPIASIVEASDVLFEALRNTLAR